MIASFNANYHKVFITGSPRNDMIGYTANDEKIKNLFNLNKYNKVVMYMPTFKSTKKGPKSQISSEFTNIFYLNDYDENDFVKMLEDNNILFILKPHPTEEFFYKKHKNIVPKSDNFKMVFNETFYYNNIQPYEIYKFVDLMISDYSSAAIDYMLLNRPVVYINSLAEDYGATRGMVLEDNFELLMPGVKVVTYKDLREQVMDGLTVDSHRAEREKFLPLMHKYRDFHSCERVYEVKARNI